EPVETRSANQLHHQDRLRASADVERDEAREVRMLRKRQQRARLLPEELEELLFRETARGRRIVIGDLERKAFCPRIVSLLAAPGEEHRACAAAAQSAQHVEGADGAVRK